MKKIIYILLFGALITSCKKEATVWESDWNAPIVNDTLTLANLVNDSTLVESPSNFYELDLTRTLFDFDINEVVTIPDTTIEKSTDNGAWANLPIPAGESLMDLADLDSIEEHELLLDDVQLKKVILKTGKFTFKIANPFETIIYFKLRLPGYSLNGTPYSEIYAVPAGSVANPYIFNKVLDLEGYHIDLTGENGSDYNKFITVIDASTGADAGTTNFGNEHVINIEVSIEDVQIDYARGYFGNRLISETTEIDLEELKIYKSGLLDLSTLSLGFEVENGLKVGAQGTLNSAMNENTLGTVVSLTGGPMGNAFNMDPATGSWGTLAPSGNMLTFTSSNSNIESYLENLGSKHTLSYQFLLNPWGNTSGSWDEIFPSSRLKVKLHAQMPLAIGMDNLVLSDTFAIDLTQNVDKTHIKSGEIVLNASNAFPFSADVSLMLLDANGNLLHTVLGTELLQASQFGDYSSVYDFNVANSEVIFALTEEAVADIDNVKFIIVKSKFNSLDPGTNTSEQMIIPIDAFLSVKLKTRFTSENRF
jgi:hypothetical protein